jgi:5-methylcytosine-specific restriction endonuclease McrA
MLSKMTLTLGQLASRIPADHIVKSTRTSTQAARRLYRFWQLYPDGFCSYCGEPDADSIDHVNPWALGGTDTFENKAPACKSCNVAKGSKTLLMFLWERAR